MTKRKAGRPALSDKDRRSIAFMLNVNCQEAKLIRKAAKGYRSMSEFLRTAALELVQWNKEEEAGRKTLARLVGDHHQVRNNILAEAQVRLAGKR